MFIYQQRITGQSLPKTGSVLFTTAAMANTSPTMVFPRLRSPGSSVQTPSGSGALRGTVGKYSQQRLKWLESACHILFFMNIEISIFFSCSFPRMVGKITMFPE